MPSGVREPPRTADPNVSSREGRVRPLATRCGYSSENDPARKPLRLGELAEPIPLALKGPDPALELVRRTIQDRPDFGGERLEREGLGHELDARIEAAVVNDGVA